MADYVCMNVSPLYVMNRFSFKQRWNLSGQLKTARQYRCEKKNIFILMGTLLSSICASGNRHVVLHKPMHPLRVATWCCLWSGDIIGPYFFANEDGQTYYDDRFFVLATHLMPQPIYDVKRKRPFN